MIGSKSVTLRISFNWLILILVLGVVLVALYFSLPKLRPDLPFVGAVVAAVGALLAAVNAIDVRVAQLQQEKAKVALDFAHRWDNPVFAPVRIAARSSQAHLVELREPQTRLAYIKEDPTRWSNLNEILNFLETLSVAVQADIADEHLSKRWFRSIVIEFWTAARDLVQLLRSQQNNPRVFLEVEALYDRWK